MQLKDQVFTFLFHLSTAPSRQYHLEHLLVSEIITIIIGLVVFELINCRVTFLYNSLVMIYFGEL